MNHSRQIKIGALISYFALFVNIVLTIFYTPWMVDKIGRSNYGLYTLAISLIGMFMLDFGLSSAVSRFLSKYRAENNKDKENEFAAAIFRLYFIIDIILFIVLFSIFFFLNIVYKNLTVEELKIFKVLYIIVSVFNLISFPATPLSGILNANEKFIQLKLCDLFNKVASVAFVVLVLSTNCNVISLVLVNTLVALITILVKYILVKKICNYRILRTKVNKGIYKELFSFSVWTTLISISQRLTYNMAPSILAITTGSVAVAIYSPASSIGSYYFNIAVAINGLFLPTISRYISNNENEKITQLMIKVGKFQSAILGLIFIGFFCVGDRFMTVWMGKEFINSYYCTLLIMFPAFFEYSQQIGNTTIVAKNYVKYQAIVLLTTSLIGIFLSFTFSNVLGEIGICISIALVGMFNVLGNNYIHSKKIGINIIEFYKSCYLKIFIPFGITILVGRIFSIWLPINGIMGLIICIIVTFLVYMCLLFKFFLSNIEKQQFFNKLRGKL